MGPGGITPGSYPATSLSQDQKQWLWNYFGHSGTVSAGYGGEGGGGGNGASGTGVAGINIPAFQFDWQAADQESLAKLTPYYEKILAETGGDVDLAKKRLEEDYQQGKRYRAEDLSTQTTADTQLAKEETQTTAEGLNKRGLLFGEIAPANSERAIAPYSQFAQTQNFDPLAQKQEARRQAITRAIDRQAEVAGLTKTRGIEDQTRGFEKYKTALTQEKQEKVPQMSQFKYNRDYAKYAATIGQASAPYMQG